MTLATCEETCHERSMELLFPMRRAMHGWVTSTLRSGGGCSWRTPDNNINNDNHVKHVREIFLGRNVSAFCVPSFTTFLPSGFSFMTAEAMSRTRETTFVGSKAQGERPSTIPAPKT